MRHFDAHASYIGGGLAEGNPRRRFSSERQLTAFKLSEANDRKWPVSDLWLEGADRSVGGTCPTLADRLKRRRDRPMFGNACCRHAVVPPLANSKLEPIRPMIQF